MLSSLSRIIVQLPVRLQLNRHVIDTRILTTLYSTFTARDFIVDRSHGESGTLTTRFVKHIALEKCKIDPLIPQKIKYSEYYPIHDMRSFSTILRETSTDQLPRLIVFTYTYKTNCDPHKFSEVLNQIDELCLRRLKSMESEDILSILYAFMYLIPNKITKLEFYEHAIRKLVNEFKEEYAGEKFVQVCFYLGLWKKNRQSMELMKYLINQHLGNYIKDVSKMDFSIISNAFFKTSTSCIDDKYQDRLTKELLSCDPKDDDLLITLVKALRLNRIKSDEIFEKLKNILVVSDLNRFQFKGLVHIFAYFADGLNNDPGICSLIINACIEKLDSIGGQDQYIYNDMRAKDLSTFLWSCSYLTTADILLNDFEFLNEIILRKLNQNEYKYYSDELIDTTLSLWILGYQSQDLVQAVLSIPQNLNQNRQDRVKLDSRLKLLLSCVQIEQPKWLSRTRNQNKCFVENRLAAEYLVKNRNALQNISSILHECKEDLGIKSLQFAAPIESLNIAGLLVETDDDRKCYVEVLEKDQMLKFGNKPIAIVALKIRLLEHLGYQVIVINHDVKSKDEILSTVRDKLNEIPPKLSVKKIAS